MQPLVSIIVPCYNYAHLLIHTLNNILQQTYPFWEVIVVDDGSTDNTKLLVADFIDRDIRFKYIYQPNSGQSAARNKGILHSKGELIQFIDADDLLESQKIEKQVVFLQQHPHIDIVYGSVRYFIDDLSPDTLLLSRWGENNPWMPEISGKGEIFVETLIKNNIAEFGCFLFRKNVVQEVGLLDENIQGVEDWDYLFRCAVANKSFYFLASENSCILMRHHPQSFSKNKKKMIEAAIKFHQKIEQLPIQVVNKRLKELNHDRIQGNKIILGNYELYRGNLLKGLYFRAKYGKTKYHLQENNIWQMILLRMKVKVKKILNRKYA